MSNVTISGILLYCFIVWLFALPFSLRCCVVINAVVIVVSVAISNVCDFLSFFFKYLGVCIVILYYVIWRSLEDSYMARVEGMRGRVWGWKSIKFRGWEWRLNSCAFENAGKFLWNFFRYRVCCVSLNVRISLLLWKQQPTTTNNVLLLYRVLPSRHLLVVCVVSIQFRLAVFLFLWAFFSFFSLLEILFVLPFFYYSRFIRVTNRYKNYFNFTFLCLLVAHRRAAAAVVGFLLVAIKKIFSIHNTFTFLSFFIFIMQRQQQQQQQREQSTVLNFLKYLISSMYSVEKFEV